MTTALANLGVPRFWQEHRAAFSARDLAQEERGTVHANQFGVVFPELRLGLSVTDTAERDEIVQAVGLKVTVKQVERPLVVNDEATCRPAVPACVPVPAHGRTPLPSPIRPPVLLMPASPGRVSHSRHMPSHELLAALVAAEIPFAECMGVFENRPVAPKAGSGNLLGKFLPRVRPLPEAITGVPAEMPARTFGDVGFDGVILTALLA
jgi:hypothetical protein